MQLLRKPNLSLPSHYIIMNVTQHKERSIGMTDHGVSIGAIEN